MKRIITIIAIFFIINANGQNPSPYDKIKQDPRISNLEDKILTIQNDIGFLKSEVVSIKNDVSQLKIDNAQLRLDNAALKKKLDSIQIVIIKYSSKFIVYQQVNDTIYIDLK